MKTVPYLSLAVFLVATSAPCVADASEKPNILLILTDDQGYGDISSHGNPDGLKTPHLDALAESGARFDRFFVSPVCAPTRASVLTGRYHLRTGVSGVTRGWENLRAEERTLAELLRDEAGYATGLFGKWHNGRHLPNHPNGQGFDTFVGFCGGHWNSYYDAPLEKNRVPFQSKGYVADAITDHALEFIADTQDGGKPWFCMVTYNTPHSPWRVDDKYWNRFNDRGLDTKAQCAYAMVENIDDNTGRLLGQLEASACADSTIVLFLTDNGANSARFNAGMKGRKGSIDEGGMRVPLFVRYPGKIAPGTVVKPIAFHLDLYPTLASYAGVPEEVVQGGLPLDGRSLVPLLSGETEGWPGNRIFFTARYNAEQGTARMNSSIRDERWRAVRPGKAPRSMDGWRLYDMQKDPGQERDISKKNRAVVEGLVGAFEDWFKELGLPDAPQEVPPPIPVGFGGEKVAELPANEALIRPGYGEGIEWSGDTPNGFANSWVQNWTSTEAFPEWRLNILTPGKYRVSIDYTCGREHVGQTITVSAGGRSVQQNIPMAFDPPLHPHPDRIYSTNYQNKEGWATLDMGVLELAEGEGLLTAKIKAFARKPGKGIDLRAVTLVRE